jgi:Ca2+-binding RTX toxin-like protein
MKHFARISAVTALVMLVGAVSGTASAAPERRFSAGFVNDSGTVIIPCVETESTNTLHFRVTKINKQGPPIRSAGVTTNGFGTTPGAPTSNSGTWTATDTATGFSLNGRQLLKANSWVQVPISATAPATITQTPFQIFEWTTTVGGPGGGKSSISGAQPVVYVVEDLDECPIPPTTPIGGGGGGGGGTTQQSGAGTPCVTPTITGGVGDTLIVGTPGNDVILDLLGNNHIEGRGGDDIICTGPGSDVVLTLGGSDVSFDQGGNNVIRTGGGKDSVTAGDGNNRINTGAGADRVSVGKGNNLIRLGKGRDRAVAGSGNDRVFGGKGKDNINGGKGKNWLRGGQKNDKLRAGKGKDRLIGGKGRDVCRGGGGKKNKFRSCEVARGKGA